MKLYQCLITGIIYMSFIGLDVFLVALKSNRTFCTTPFQRSRLFLDLVLLCHLKRHVGDIILEILHGMRR